MRRKEKGHVLSVLTQNCTWPVCVRISVLFFWESGVEVKWTEGISWFCGMELRWESALALPLGQRNYHPSALALSSRELFPRWSTGPSSLPRSCLPPCQGQSIWWQTSSGSWLGIMPHTWYSLNQVLLIKQVFSGLCVFWTYIRRNNNVIKSLLESRQKCLKQPLMKKVDVTFPTCSLSVFFSFLSASKKTLFWPTQPLHTHFLEHCV